MNMGVAARCWLPPSPSDDQARPLMGSPQRRQLRNVFAHRAMGSEGDVNADACADVVATLAGPEHQVHTQVKQVQHAAKRYRTGDGRAYEHDLETGRVTWLDELPPPLPAVRVAAAIPKLAISQALPMALPSAQLFGVPPWLVSAPAFPCLSLPCSSAGPCAPPAGIAPSHLAQMAPLAAAARGAAPAARLAGGPELVIDDID